MSSCAVRVYEAAVLMAKLKGGCIMENLKKEEEKEDT